MQGAVAVFCVELHFDRNLVADLRSQCFAQTPVQIQAKFALASGRGSGARLEGAEKPRAVRVLQVFVRATAIFPLDHVSMISHLGAPEDSDRAEQKQTWLNRGFENNPRGDD